MGDPDGEAGPHRTASADEVRPRILLKHVVNHLQHRCPPLLDGAVEEEQQVKEMERKQQRSQSELILQGADDGSAEPASKTVQRTGDKVGRNDPCPCGSGQKYKNCHGKLA